MTGATSTAARAISHDHDAFEWRGAVDVRHTDTWSQAWRLPHDRLDLFHDDDLRNRAGMPTGVRLAFRTDSPSIVARAVPGEDWADMAPMDLVIDGEFHSTAARTPDGVFCFDGLPSGEHDVALWLPHFGTFRLAVVELVEGSVLRPPAPVPESRLVVYGSSITQCRVATSPTKTWPGIVARRLHLDLTCLGFGGQCHLDPMVARLIRDRPADVIITCLGINVYGGGTLNERSFLPAVLGFLSTIRDGHAGTPILVISPILSPGREDSPGAGGMTLAAMRDAVAEAVRLLRVHGDDDVHLLDGRDVIGPSDADVLFDGLHPNAEGYRLMGDRITETVRDLVPVIQRRCDDA